MREPTPQDFLNLQFYEWCKRCQGWTVWDHAVEPEPPFVPFVAHYVPQLAPNNVVDDAKKHTLLSFLYEQGKELLQPKPKPEELPDWYQATFFIDPIPFPYQEEIIELELIVPQGYITKERFINKCGHFEYLCWNKLSSYGPYI